MAVEIKIISLYSKILEYAWFLMISIQKKFYLKLSKYITITKTKLYLHSQNEMELRQYPDNSRFFKTDKKHTKKKPFFLQRQEKDRSSFLLLKPNPLLSSFPILFQSFNVLDQMVWSLNFVNVDLRCAIHSVSMDTDYRRKA